MMRHQSMVSAALCLTVAAVTACGDDAGEAGETDASGSTSTSTTSTTGTPTSGTSGGTTSAGTTTEASTTQSTGTTDTTMGSSGSTDGTGGTGTSGSTGSSGSSGSSGSTGVGGDCHPVLVEVVYNPGDTPDMLQWVRLYNPCEQTIDLSAYTLGYGGTFYTELDRTKALTGDLGAGECYLVGGPTSSVLNGDPTLDLPEDFMPSLDVAATVGNGIALFEGAPEDIDGTTIPLDAVIYGPNNDNDLIDASGVAPDVAMVSNPPSSGAIRRTALDPTWTASATPTPNVCPPF